MVLLFVGVITLLFILDALLPLRKKLEGLPPSKPWGAFWGGFAGFTSFISHTGGPPFQIYVLPQRLTPVHLLRHHRVLLRHRQHRQAHPLFLPRPAQRRQPRPRRASSRRSRIVGVMVGVWLVRRISVKLFYQLAYWLVFLLAAEADL